MQHHCAPEIESRADASHISCASLTQLVLEERLDVLGENTARRQFVAIARFGEERLAPQSLRGELNCLLEWQVFERVQRIVMNKNADGTLSRQQARQVVD